jgi:hypothetical protein
MLVKELFVTISRTIFPIHYLFYPYFAPKGAEQNLNTMPKTFPLVGKGKGAHKKRASFKTGPFCKISFCNNKTLPADPNWRTEVIKPIKKAVVTCTFHFAFNMWANIGFLFQIKT